MPPFQGWQHCHQWHVPSSGLHSITTRTSTRPCPWSGPTKQSNCPLSSSTVHLIRRWASCLQVPHSGGGAGPRPVITLDRGPRSGYSGLQGPPDGLQAHLIGPVLDVVGVPAGPRWLEPRRGWDMAQAWAVLRGNRRRRVPAGTDPIAADGDGQGIIQSEVNDRRSSTSRQPDDLRAVRAPGEVSRPRLSAGMEQRNDFQGLGIPAFRLGPLVLITELTGKAEIVLGTRSAPNNGYHMVDLKPTQHVVLVA